jgi:hypothetical protein
VDDDLRRRHDTPAIAGAEIAMNKMKRDRRPTYTTLSFH